MPADSTIVSSDDELFAFYRRMAELGIDAGKLKVGLDLRADIRRLGIMRDALSTASPRPRLMIDGNEYWSPKQAVRHIRQIEQHFDLEWVEEPARRWDYDGLRLVSRQVRAAVATAENVNSIADVYPLIANGAVDVLNVSALHSGVTGCRQIARMAQTHGLPVSMMNCQANFMAHVAAALPNHTMMEVVDPGREHCLEFDSRIDDGCIVLGDAPGFGIEIDAAKLAALQANPPTGRGRFPVPAPRRRGPLHRAAGAGRGTLAPRSSDARARSAVERKAVAVDVVDLQRTGRDFGDVDLSLAGGREQQVGRMRALGLDASRDRAHADRAP